MSLAAIEVRFPDKILKPDDVERRRVLTALEVMYEGGSLHGTTDDFPTRDLSQIVVGLHRRNWHFLETYKRTICIDIRSRRVIFRCADLTFKRNKGSWWNRLLAVLRMRKLKPIANFLFTGWHRLAVFQLVAHRRYGILADEVNSNASKQEMTIAELKSGVEALTAMVKEQASQIQKANARLRIHLAILALKLRLA